jgi:putative ubiquitin-RnfH superfamily antitoxin RatB of RatAB toxin-antitoxin module
MAESIRVEVAYAEPSRQFLRSLVLPAGSTIAIAIAAAGVDAELRIDSSKLDCGIWSKPAARDTELRDGDRVELYRPLVADPKEARRRRARQP